MVKSVQKAQNRIDNKYIYVKLLLVEADGDISAQKHTAKSSEEENDEHHRYQSEKN